MTHRLKQFPQQRRRRLLTGFQRHKGVDPLSFQVMRHADDCGFGYGRMLAERSLNLRRPQAMARDINHIVYPTGDPVVTILIPTTTVTGEVLPRIKRKIGLAKAFVIAIHGPHYSWPRELNAQVAGDIIASEFIALIIDHARLHAKERQSRRAWLGPDRARERGNENAAGFGLPPGIHDRAALLANDPVVPVPFRTLDRLTDCAENPQARQIMLGWPGVSFFHQRTQGGRRGIENIDLVFRYYFPETAEVGIVGNTLEHDTGGPVGQRTVNDVTVTSHPADVCRAPVNVTRSVVEDVLVRHGHVDQITASGMQYSLRLPGRARGVKDKQGVLSIHRL